MCCLWATGRSDPQVRTKCPEAYKANSSCRPGTKLGAKQGPCQTLTLVALEGRLHPQEPITRDVCDVEGARRRDVTYRRCVLDHAGSLVAPPRMLKPESHREPPPKGEGEEAEGFQSVRRNTDCARATTARCIQPPTLKAPSRAKARAPLEFKPGSRVELCWRWRNHSP